MSHLATTAKLFQERAGLDPKRLEALVDRALAKADDGELFLEYRQSEGLVFDDGRVKTASFDVTQGFGLSASQALAAVRAQNVQFAAGSVGAAPAPESQGYTATVTAEGRSAQTALPLAALGQDDEDEE